MIKAVGRVFALPLKAMFSAQEVAVGGNADRWYCQQLRGHRDPKPAKENKYNAVGNIFLLPCSLLKVSSVTGLNSLTKSGSAQILEEDNFPGSLIPQDPAV